MKKISLVAINSRYSHSNLALYYLRTYVEDLDYDIKIIEFTINRKEDEIIKTIINEKSCAVAFSVYIWNVEIIKSILPGIKTEDYKPFIILGGPEVSYDEDEWFKNYPETDFIIPGSGEAGFRYLLLKNITSINKIIKINNPRFDNIPFPYKTEDFLNMKKKYIYYESSRGCSYKCTFCFSSRKDQKLEFKNIKKIKNELITIMRHKPEMIKFIDRTFNAKKSHFMEIWEFITENFSHNGSVFHFEIYPGLLDEGDFNFLKSCPGGLFQFEIGIQSTNEKTLKEIKRDSWEAIKINVKKIMEIKNIHIHLDQIVGLPHENLKSIKNSFNEIYTLKADHFQMGFLKLLRGTKIYDKKNVYEMVCFNEAPYRIKSNRWLKEDEVEKLVKISKLINLLYNSRRFKITLKKLETLFQNPFQMYDELAEYIYLNFKKHQSKKWEILSDELLKFVAHNFPGKEKYFADCLRWDWCKSSKSHYYPKQLIPVNSKKIKKTGINYFKKISINGIIKHGDSRFNLSELRNSTFFSPETMAFKNEFLGKHNLVLFLSYNKKTIFFSPEKL